VDWFRDAIDQKALAALRAAFAATPPRNVISLANTWGSASALLAARLAADSGCLVCMVTAHADEADEVRDDVETVIGVVPDLLPIADAGRDGEPDEEIQAERLRLVLALAGGGSPVAAGPRIITAPIAALMQPVPAPAAILDQSLSVRRGGRLEPESLGRWLDEHGFQACDQVEVPGDFSRRGGIVDVFCDAYRDAIRVEFFGDEIESVRLFDAGTQRSAQEVESVRIPARRAARREKPSQDATTSFLSLLPADAIMVLNEPAEIQEIGRTYWQRLGERAGMFPVDAVFRQAAALTQVHLNRFPTGASGEIILDVGSLPQFEAKPAEALAALRDLAQTHDVVVFCDSPAEEHRFREHLTEPEKAVEPQPDVAKKRGKPAAPRSAEPQQPATSTIPIPIPPRLKTAVGAVTRGFRWGTTVFVPHHEIFHRFRRQRSIRRVAPARPIDSFFDLSAGDYVVHAAHGIGRFRGLQTLERGEKRDEYLLIEFADDAQVHVPASQIHVVQKYIGSFRGKPKLSKLGGTAWKKTKERVADAVGDLAAELLAVQAQRQTQPGIAFPADTAWQREFEEAFAFTETADQLRAVADIKSDLARPQPMDRLLCGDVGFGKTELAMRAAFKVVEYGKQAAVLVPTTVLAEQHYETFRERFADYPFTIEAISRFRTSAEQKQIIKRTRAGQIDILIGTHRLLSADVHFADLGLVIIDEEQRFGVEAKERLKRMRATVEVLTLSATPIPRTLHMAMLGMRDISSLATPPLDRRSIVTQVRMWDDALIREALVRELSRDGQCYFVHNFVRDLEHVANRIRALVPDARVVVGHGQMSGPELEDVMLRFMHREADVLVSTNIIESGIDIPTANTMFINRADRFGLADLHQLRGRVGRYKHRAYCYLLLSPQHPVQDSAARRLKAIEHYSDLGAGFQIAMRDLEIRGAGNILGPEQSGNIEAVGYEMYCQLLEQAVRRMKNEPAEPWKPVNLELGITARIPRAYIHAEKQRMEVYKRLASCRTVEEVRELDADLRDAYGPLPAELITLLACAEIRALAQPWGIRSIVVSEPDVVFAIDDLARVQNLFTEGPGSPRIPDARTIHWRLPNRLLDPSNLLDVLRTQLTAAAPAATTL
jgi:transcription-repair coupling factor (superfamily II helicase)